MHHVTNHTFSFWPAVFRFCAIAPVVTKFLSFHQSNLVMVLWSYIVQLCTNTPLEQLASMRWSQLVRAWLFSVAVAQYPPSVLDYVNPLIGSTGTTPDPNSSGGMIPSTAPPFAFTRFTPMTRENNVSVLPYDFKDNISYGFMGTHQPAIWMVNVSPFMCHIDTI